MFDQHLKPTDLPWPLEQLSKTQQRFVPFLLDPTTRHLPVEELAGRAGLRSSASWYMALRDAAFRTWVEQLGRPCPPARPAVADALAGRIPLEQALTVAQQRFWYLLQEPDNRKLPRLELCRKAGYTTDRQWYESVQDADFRTWVRSLGIKCTRMRQQRLPSRPRADSPG